MEGIALNFDHHQLVTQVQCRDLGTLQEALKKLFVGLQNNAAAPFFSKEGSARLQKILACHAMDSQKICDIFWQTWKIYQKSNEPLHVSPSRSNAHHVSNGHQAPKQTKSVSNGANVHVEGTNTDTQLHVLDYLSVLSCKSDRKSKELVASHSSIAKSKYMQVHHITEV